MTQDNQTRQNRVREALGKIYDQQPPYFREYLQKFKEDPTSRVFAPLAEAYRRMGRVDDAIEICREGLEHHPDFHGGRVALAKCYLDKRLYPEAQAELERVIQMVPENLLAQRLLGDAFLAQGNQRLALHPYKMALLLSPSDVSLAERVHGLEKSLQQAGIFEESTPLDKGDAISLEELPTGVKPMARNAEPPREERFQPASVEEWSFQVDDSAPVPELESGPVKSAAVDPLAAPESLFTRSEEEASEELGESERAKIDELLGVDRDEPEESFKIEHVSAIFGEESREGKKEITTSTLGDLYFSQGQFDRALRIFEKLQQSRPSPDVARKINDCRAKLGVDKTALIRNRKIHTLRRILKRVREMRAAEVAG